MSARKRQYYISFGNNQVLYHTFNVKVEDQIKSSIGGQENIRFEWEND